MLWLNDTKMGHRIHIPILVIIQPWTKSSETQSQLCKYKPSKHTNVARCIERFWSLISNWWKLQPNTYINVVLQKTEKKIWQQNFPCFTEIGVQHCPDLFSPSSDSEWQLILQLNEEISQYYPRSHRQICQVFSFSTTGSRLHIHHFRNSSSPISCLSKDTYILLGK